MGIFDAMTTAVGGMASQSYALENISGNIANSQTTGYKRTDSSFADMIGGGSVTTYDSLGSPVDVQTRWAKVANADSTTTPATKDTWQLYYATGDTTTPWAVVGSTSGTATQFTFNSDGTLASPSPATVSQPNMTVNGNNLGTISLDFTGGLTQSYTSTHTPNLTMDQNGNSAGTSATVSIDTNGRVKALFNNGQTKTLSQIPLATFSGAAFLRKMDGGAFAATTESGSASINASSNFVGGSLESSNVDVSEEFSKLIVTQQAYSANTKIISTANTMMQDTINIIR